MKTDGTITRWIRLVLAAAMALAVGLAITPNGLSPDVEAASVAPTTLFEIDGNPAGPNDFDAPYGPGLTPEGFPTTGLYYNERTIDQGGTSGCGIVNDPSTAKGGVKIADGPDYLRPGTDPNSKTDLDFIDLAAEKVDRDGEIFDILYVGYRKCGGEGTWQTSLYLDDGDGLKPSEGDAEGDFLFLFEFNPNDNTVDFRQYRRENSQWALQTADSTFIQGSASEDYGEVALNLSELIFRDNDVTTCTTLVVSGPVASITGGSFGLTSQPKDLLAFDPLRIDNCGGLDVTKLADPDVTSDDLFAYEVDRLSADGAQTGPGTVHDASLTPIDGEPDGDNEELDADILVNETHEWSPVVAGTDYTITETSIPAGWALESIVCSGPDIFAANFPVIDVVIYENGAYTGNSYSVAPDTIGDDGAVDGFIDLPDTTCTITNATSGVVVAKVGSGDPATQFAFDVVDNDASASVDTPSLALGEQSNIVAVTPGTSVTITETLPVGTPGWTLSSVVCTYDPGTGVIEVWNSTTELTPTFDTVPGQTITCTFTNNQAGQINVVKTGDGAVSGPFEFDTDYGTNFTLNIGDPADNSGDLTAGDYAVSELLAALNASIAPAPAFIGSFECVVTTEGAGTSTFGGSGVDATVTLGAGDIVTCTFANTQNGRIIVDKAAINGDAEFDFTGDVSGSIQTVDGSTPAGVELTADLAPGIYAVAESPEPGWTLTDTSCTDGSAVDAIDLAAGEIVTCSFENSRNEATFTLEKRWGDGTLDGEVVNLGATVAGPDPIAGSIAATATSPNGAAGTNTVTVYSGQTVSFSETFQTPGAGDGYITSLDCGDVGTMTLTPAGDSRGGSLDVGDTPSDVTCTFTNTPKVAGVALQKAWADNSRVGDSAVLTLSTDPTGASDVATSNATDDAVFNGPTATDDNTAFVGVVAGDTVTFGEDLGVATGNYTTEFECVGATNTPTEISDDVYTLLIATDDVDSDATIFCTFTNTRIEVPLVLEKDWDDAKAGDSVTLSATGSDTTPIEYVSVADSADETDTSDPFTVYAGETVTLAEVFGAGQGAAYDQSLSCTGATDTDLTDDELTISPLDPLDGDNAITCTWVNARRSVDVVVAKSLSPVGSGSFDLSINDVVVVDGAGDGDSNDATPVSVFVGDSVAVSEAADAGAPLLANFASSLACDSGIVVDPNDGVSGGFDVPRDLATGTTITCTFTNVRNEAQLIVTKSWADSPVNGDAVALSSDGGLAGRAVGANSNNGDDGDDADVISTVYGGETISVAEVFGPGDSANYATTLVCSDAFGNLADTADSLTGAFPVPADPTDITCTFTNTRLRTELTLRKQWILGATGDTADLTVVGEAGTGEAQSTATFGQALDPSDGAETTITVYAGETVDLDEVVTPGENYDSTLVCTLPENDPTGADRSFDLAISPLDVDPITCTFVNTRKEVDIELVKSWADSPANGDTVALTIVGALVGTDGSDSNDGDDANDSSATITALAGETVTLDEVFGPGLAENYTTSLECSDGASTLTYTDGALTGDLAVDAADEDLPIICTFTNVRKSTDLVLQKTWVDAVAGDTADLTATGQDGALVTDTDTQTATAPAGSGTSATTATITVYAGQAVTLAEAFGPNTATYDSTAFACTSGDQSPAWQDGELAAALNVSAADVDAANTAGEPITCTFTNTAQRGTIVIVKSIDGVNDGTFDFESDWSADGVTSNPADTDPVDFSITTNALTGAVTFADVLVGSFTVSETDSGANFDGTTVTCVEAGGDDGSGPDGGTDLPLTGSIDLDNGETVTCTFTNTERSTIVVVKDAQPDAAQDFSFTTTEPATFDLLDDAFALDDDADGALSNTYTSVLVPGGETYSVTELDTPGWTLDSSSSCTAGGAFDGATATITPAPGTTVTCTFVNTANPAGISATKAVEGQVGPWGPFEFTLAGGTFTGAATQAVDSVDATADWSDLVEGQQYTLTEAQVPGYETGAEFTCVVLVPGGADFVALPDADDATDGFQFAAVAGAIYDCDITNVAVPGSVDVTKSVTGVADDSAWAFDFTIDPDAPPANPQSASGVGNTTSAPVSWTDLVPGVTYTVTETSVPGWTAGAIECTVTPADQGADPVVTTDGSFTVTPGASVSCDFDNAADPGSVDVTKTVTGVADDLAWAFDFTIDPVPVSDPVQDATQSASGVGNVTSSSVSWTDLVPGVTYTVTETVPAGWTQGPIVCTVTPADQGADPVVTTEGSFTVTPGASVSCDFDNAANPGDVDVTKTVIGVDADLAWSFDFTIDPLPAGETNPKTASGVGNETSDPVSWAGLVPGVTYTVTETVPAGWTQGPIECTVTPADQGADPVVTTDGSFTVTPGASVSCDFDNSVNPSEVSVTKLVDGGLDAAQGWEFEFTLTPDANPVGSLTASGTGDGSDTVTWTNLVPGSEYVMAEVLPGGNTTTYANGVLSCTGADDTDDDDQTVTFTAPVGGAGVEVECTVTNTALSDVSFDKVVDSVTRDADSGVWTITYLIDVVNADDAGAGVYDLSDEFRFGAGVTIVDGSASVTNTDPGTITTNAAFDGVGDTSVVTAESIASATTHTYLVRVDVTIAVGPDTDGDCIGEPGDGTGFLNTAQITVDGGEPVTTEACAGFAQLTLVKNLINDDGGNGTIADFPLTAEGPASLSGVSGSDGVSSAVPAGSYALAEDELVDGYTNAGFVCEGATDSSSSSVLLADGDNPTCTIVNDDEPIDLELTKDDGGAEAVAGGAPFDYTISVRNIGTRDLDLDEPVTVTDELPAGLSWVSFPANCSQAGQTLTCDVDPALLPAGGELVVITATVEADADAASGVYVNKASVTTEDDTTTNPPCPALDDNNVDCEETPVDRNGGVQIVKTDDVADGASVQPGDTFTYELVVTNTGVSTLLPGTHVEDDLPAQLDFVSAVGGAGWTCNDTSPIDCDYAPELQPGASAPSIIVTVSVAEDASGENIENVAIVRAAVDRDCPSGTARLIESFAPACNEVTDDDDETTPLSANADLAIVKTASVDEVGAGGGFDWILDISNNGPGTAVNVVIGDLVPTAVVVTSVSSDDFDCGNDGNTVSCTVASLAVGESGTVTIAVSVPLTAPDAEVVNVGTVESDTPDPDLSNNSDEASVTLVGIAPPTTTLPPITLPPTGSNGTDPLTRAGMVFLLLGGGFILISRRRRGDVTTG